MDEIYEWNIIEDLIEELHIRLNRKHGTIEEKKVNYPIGRPKKVIQQVQKQLKIDDMINNNNISRDIEMKN